MVKNLKSEKQVLIERQSGEASEQVQGLYKTIEELKQKNESLLKSQTDQTQSFEAQVDTLEKQKIELVKEKETSTEANKFL